MSTYSFKQAASVLAVGLFTAGMAFADAATGGATEVTQMLNNAELVAGVKKQIETVDQLYKTYLVTYQQLEEQIKQGQRLASGDAFRSLGSLQSEINAISRYQASLRGAGADLDSLRRIMDQRSVEAKMKGVTLQEYLANEKVKIQQGDARSRQRLDTEKNLLLQVNQDMDEAKNLSSKITTTDTNQSIQVLNLHMNKIIQQNARMTQIMAYQTGTQEAERMEKENLAREKSKQALEAYAAERKASLEKQVGDMNAATTSRARVRQ